MSLIFSAVVPNSPLLIPSVGKDDLKYAKKTTDALGKLEEELYAAKPQTIIIISGHKRIFNTNFSINLTPEYSSNFKNFGNFSESKNYSCDLAMCHHVREALEGKIPIKLYSEKELDYEISVPLFYLTQNITNFSIVPMSFSDLDTQSHFNFGQNLKDIIFETTKRIAIIAAGDLSNNIGEKSNENTSKDVDKKIINYLKTKSIKKFIRTNPDSIFKAGAENGYLSLLILLGIMDEINYSPELLSYEFPFDVGMLTMNFKLN
ncbi:MAG: class III extradiol dioxygenase subunit B-like domain-containing protein [bacterium]